MITCKCGSTEFVTKRTWKLAGGRLFSKNDADKPSGAGAALEISAMSCTKCGRKYRVTRKI